MADMLVKLYELPEVSPLIAELKSKGIDIRRAIPPEKHIVIEWVKKEFGQAWASETEKAMANQPPSCFIAVDIEKNAIVGFACHDATCKNFFGPTGVKEEYRKMGIGKALLLMCLHAMAWQGYGYAIIGGVGPVEFYKKTVGAILIEDSTPGIYRGMLKS